MAFFDRFSIYQRIFAGFVVVLSLCAVLAIASIQGMHIVEGNVGNSRATAAAALAAEQFGSSVIDLNYKVTRYALTGTSTDRSAAHEQLVAAAESLRAVETVTGKDDPRVAELREHFARYQTAAAQTFTSASDRFVAGEELKKRSIELANLMSAVAARLLRDNLSDLLPTGVRLDESLQASLVAATRYLSSQNPADADAAKSALANLEEDTASLATAAGRDAKLQRFAAAMPPAIKNYAGAIGALIHATDLFIAATRQREEAGQALRDTASELRRSNVETEDAAVRSTSRTLDRVGSMNLGLAIVVLVTGCGIAYFLSRGIALSLAGMTDVMKSLASGDLGIEVPQSARRHEIGQMARAVEVFKENALAVRRLEEQQKEIQRRSEAVRHEEMLRFADAFDATVSAVVESVASASAELGAEAEQMTTTAGLATAKADAVAAASGRASHNVETVATATEELTVSFNEIGRQVIDASAIAKEARGEAERTEQRIQGLADSARKIDGVIELIQGIARQTNLLALNATIEAARAGDAGKGFSIVASEVKSLANQTAQATEEISLQIQSMQASSKGVVEAIAIILATMERIDAISSTIASAVEQQLVAAQQIARSVQQAARETHEVSETINGVTAASGETDAAAGHVLTAARGLSEQSERLRRELDGFLSKVRAA
jgi:methyl-accepting chemotaxis protein